MPPKRAPEDLPVPLIDAMKDKSMEERYASAVDAMHASGYHNNGDTKLSLRRAAELYGVFRSTLERRFKGTARPHTTAHENQQKLTHAEEEVLVHWARHMASRGVPLTRATMRDYAQKISGKYIGKH